MSTLSEAGLRVPSAATPVEPELPAPGTWNLGKAEWAGSPQRLCATERGSALLLESPLLELRAGRVYTFLISFRLVGGSVTAVLTDDGYGEVRRRTLRGSGDFICPLQLRIERPGWYRLSLVAGDGPAPAALEELRVDLRSAELPAVAKIQPTFLPHWRWWQRRVHTLCRRSRFLNSIVAAFEFHSGREEVLSLPQYMALCPTGQCNASCDFCSVTIRRTGIIKKALPFEKVESFVGPVSNTVRLFGLEGNGEPTLYERFDDLVQRLTANGAPIYLITNGERLTPEQVALLVGCPTDSVNVSLNAATAPTHRTVMKLKGFDDVLANIDRLVRWRGDASNPMVSVSFVVTRQNIREVQDFLLLAEWGLRVDRILVRPLSEIANEDGTVEDLRELVPYEQEIEDMLDSVEEYLDSIPRRADISLDPETFKAFRPDAPHSDETAATEILPPRRRYWTSLDPRVRAEWRLAELRLCCDDEVARGPVYRSDWMDVAPSTELGLDFSAVVVGGELTLAVVGTDGQAVAEATVRHAESGPRRMRLRVPTGRHSALALQFSGSGEAFDVRIRFQRLRTPRRRRPDSFRLPYPKRWQTDTPGTQVEWAGTTLRVRATAAPGLYLVRSYAIPCDAGQAVRLPIEVAVETGELGIGVLSEDSQSWVADFRFAPGSGPREIAFSTGENRRVQFVLFSGRADELRASVDFGESLDAAPLFLERRIDPSRVLLPPASGWGSHPAASLSWQGARLTLRSDRPPEAWLAWTERLPSVGLHRCVNTVRARVRVREGSLRVVFLAQSDAQPDREEWALKAVFLPGEHEHVFEVPPRQQNFLRVTLSSAGKKPLDATVDWLDGLGLPRDVGFVPHAAAAANLAEALALTLAPTSVASQGSAVPAPPVVPANGPQRLAPAAFSLTGLLGRISKIRRHSGWQGVVRRTWVVLTRTLLPIRRPVRRLARVARARGRRHLAQTVQRVLRLRFGRPDFYCLKPWTDVHNFTVDGRMDVCCIATGLSQQRYALGNAFEHSFQEIWNGERMREFRSTVNTARKLPPCARCPMAAGHPPPLL